ncbi:hypothetical protein GALL_497030 [mine drainage metagenome]|uniref:Bacterial transcriptional activator domain-containing protein n=1 Tax=mine drainage metagenome TaxID=410659 RepID=A0A1J5PBK1_9ZZZZ
MQFEEPARRTTLWQEHRSDMIHRSLDHLLAMAHRYRNEGRVRQAMELYWMLSEDHSGTTQALEAQGCLLELADAYEREDARHTARAVYERLLLPVQRKDAPHDLESRRVSLS